MAQRIGLEAILDMTNFNKGMTQYNQGVQQMTGQASKAAGGFNALNTAITAVAGYSLIRLADMAANAAWELAKLGVEAQRTESSFRRVAAGVGASSDAIINAMNEAVQGTVDDEEMMAVATKAMIMGLELTADEWGQLMQGARNHARLLGMDTIQVFEGMVQAIERGQPRMLTALGFAGARDAIKAYADEMEGTATSMSEAERQGALLKLVMESINSEAAKFGTAEYDMVDEIDALNVAWGNLKETMGQGMAPGLTGILKTATNFLELDKATTELMQATYGLTGSWDEYNRVIAKTAGMTTEAKTAFIRAYLAASDGSEAILIFADAFTTLGKKASAAARTVSRAMAGILSEYKKFPESVSPTGLFTDPASINDYIRAQHQAANESAQNRLKAEKEAADEAAKAWEKSADDAAQAWESAWDSLRSDVEAALQQTTVTAQDMSDTALGIYVDKWDENRRRLEAIAERGFAELAVHPDWATILQIPPGLGEQQLKDWARGMANAGPEVWGDVNTAVETVHKYILQKAAQSSFYEEVTAAYAKKYGVGVGAAKAAVGGAMGTPAQQAAAAVGSLPSDLAGAVKGIMPQMETAAEPIGKAIVAGIKQGIEKEWATFTSWIMAQFSSVTSAVQDIYEVESPSKVFAKIGQNIVAGFQQGLGGGVSMTVGGMRAMTAAHAVGAPARAGSPGMAGVTNNNLGGDTIVQNISDPVSFYLAQAIVQDRKRDRWNAVMGV